MLSGTTSASPLILIDGVPYYETKYGDSCSRLPTATDPKTEVMENEGYTVFDARFSHPFLAKWEAYLTVSNLSDENYEPESGYPAQGRTFWLGVSYKY